MYNFLMSAVNHDRHNDAYLRNIVRDSKTIAVVGAAANRNRPSYFALKSGASEFCRINRSARTWSSRQSAQLFRRLPHNALAGQQRVSVARPFVRRHLDATAKAHRQRPKDCERAVINFAENPMRPYHEPLGQ
jgi:hypothetical protein